MSVRSRKPDHLEPDPHSMQTTLIFYYYRDIKIESIWTLKWSVQDRRFKVFCPPCWGSELNVCFLDLPKVLYRPLFLLLPQIVSNRLAGQRCSCIKLSPRHLYSLAVSLFGCFVEALNASSKKSCFLSTKTVPTDALRCSGNWRFKDTSFSPTQKSHEYLRLECEVKTFLFDLTNNTAPSFSETHGTYTQWLFFSFYLYNLKNGKIFMTL